MCAARKRWFVVAGAAMVYAGLLRIFPGLVVFGWLMPAIDAKKDNKRK